MPETIGSDLPAVSPVEAAMAATSLGGVLMNFLVNHALLFKAEDRFKALDRAVSLAKDAAEVGNFVRGSEEEQANAKQLVLAIIAQANAVARHEIARRGQGDPSKVN